MIRTILVFSLLSFSIFAQTAIQKGQQLVEEKKYDEAKNYYENLLESDSQNDSIFFQLALVWINLKDWDEATEYAEKAVEMKPNDVGYIYRLGTIYGMDARQASIFRQPGLASSFKEYMEKTLELDPDHLGANISLTQFHRMAPGIMGGDTELAFKHAEKVKTLNERRGSFLLAQIYLDEEMLDKAEKEFLFLNEKYGNDKDFWYFHNTYGYYLMGQNRLDEALVTLKKQVELAPERANSHDSLGEVYRKKGMLKESLTSYKKALELNPESEYAKETIEEIEEELKM